MAKILVVDDEPDLRFILRRMFERDRHEVREAGNGREALLAIAEALPDLVVTDIMMPVMDGNELIRRLRSDPAHASIPILVVTAYGGHASVGDAVVVLKPYRLAPLMATVNELLAGKANGT